HDRPAVQHRSPARAGHDLRQRRVPQSQDARLQGAARRSRRAGQRDPGAARALRRHADRRGRGRRLHRTPHAPQLAGRGGLRPDHVRRDRALAPPARHPARGGGRAADVRLQRREREGRGPGGGAERALRRRGRRGARGWARGAAGRGAGGGARGSTTPGRAGTPPGAPGQPQGPQPIFKEEVRIVDDPVTNSLVVLATKRDYQLIADVLKKIDVVPRQVLLEVTIAEITLDKSLKFGVEWALAQGKLSQTVAQDSSGTSIFRTGPQGLPVGGSLGDGSVTRIPGAGAFAVISDREHFNVLINALQQRTNVKMLSAPHIMAADNREAHILVGNSIP